MAANNRWDAHLIRFRAWNGYTAYTYITARDQAHAEQIAESHGWTILEPAPTPAPGAPLAAPTVTVTRVDRTHADADRLEYSCGHSQRFTGTGERGAGYFVQVGHRAHCRECATPTYCAVQGVCHLAPPAPQTPGAVLRAELAAHSDYCAQAGHALCTLPTCACRCHPAPPMSHQAREAAQRADEAELATVYYDWLCFDCGHRFEAAREDYFCPRCQSPCTCTPNSSAHTPPARDDEAHSYAAWATPTLAQRIALALEGRLPAMAGGAATCFYCEHHGDGTVPATQRVTFVDNDAPRSEWVCDNCRVIYFPDVPRDPPPIRGGAPTPADDPAGPGAPAEAELHTCLCCGASGTVQDVLYHHLCARCSHRCDYPPCGRSAPYFCTICTPPAHDAEALLATLPNGQEIRGTVQPDGKVHVTHWPAATVTSTHRHGIMGAILEALDPERYAQEFPDAPHTHPCPTCHQARPCTGTGCADGPRECATCSNCRGW